MIVGSVAWTSAHDISCGHVKIDKSLLADLHPGSKASLLVAGAINRGGLDMKVAAEGVETQEQAALLHAAGCDQLQGYLFGRTVPIADFRAAYSASLCAHGLELPERRVV